MWDKAGEGYAQSLGSADTWGHCSQCWDAAKKGKGHPSPHMLFSPVSTPFSPGGGWRPGRGVVT